jgi:hypothetical protein
MTAVNDRPTVDFHDRRTGGLVGSVPAASESELGVVLAPRPPSSAVPGSGTRHGWSASTRTACPRSPSRRPAGCRRKHGADTGLMKAEGPRDVPSPAEQLRESLVPAPSTRSGEQARMPSARTLRCLAGPRAAG